MSDYLAGYGAGDERREKRTKRIVLIVVAALVVGGILFALLRNFTEERAAKRFQEALKASDFQSAYRMWGCTEQTPCRDYSFDRFLKDWGPKGTYAQPASIRYSEVDRCGDGVVLTIDYPGVEQAGLYVDASTKVLSFAPWPRCPGRHWNFRSFWHNLFGGSEPPPPPAPAAAK